MNGKLSAGGSDSGGPWRHFLCDAGLTCLRSRAERKLRSNQVSSSARPRKPRFLIYCEDGGTNALYQALGKVQWNAALASGSHVPFNGRNGIYHLSMGEWMAPRAWSQQWRGWGTVLRGQESSTCEGQEGVCLHRQCHTTRAFPGEATAILHETRRLIRRKWGDTGWKGHQMQTTNGF